MPKDPNFKSVLLIGSGPIIIGQACEFDYSGSQGSTSLREEGIEVTILNSNPATIMTDPMMADNIYLLPLEINSILTILSEHKIDAVLPTLGGQTALNLTKICEEQGLWKKHNIQIIGVDLATINNTEDRALFYQKMLQNNIQIPLSKEIYTLAEGLLFVKKIGLPVIMRSSFSLGGHGARELYTTDEVEVALNQHFSLPTNTSLTLDQSISGWKEFELELLRDSKNQTVIIGSIENFNPMGVHTGDSITVMPPMTLPDTVYQEMRALAFRVMDVIGAFSGACNVQFAVSPQEEIVVIEVNPRLSRSSALASKATGYPMAAIASKLALGYSLDELRNPIINTSAFFEPSIDYVVVKIPRWNFEKFKSINGKEDHTLGIEMKSIGETMAIGRSFNEALLKALDSLELNKKYYQSEIYHYNLQEFIASLKKKTSDLIIILLGAFEKYPNNITIDQVHQWTKIDRWFLFEVKKIANLLLSLSTHSEKSIPANLLLELKKNGLSDSIIASRLNCTEDQIHTKRQCFNIVRTYQSVDSCAAEFPVTAPYYYSSFGHAGEIIINPRTKVLFLGSGPNRIGQGIEFDYLSVHGIKAVQLLGHEAILVNNNPETVSTDFKVADKLYFEPIEWEYILPILQKEKPLGVIVQLGGQTALKLAQKIHESGFNILGSSTETIDIMEDRNRFSSFLQKLKIPYPKYQKGEIGTNFPFPFIIRPSYVLGGSGMSIIRNETEWQSYKSLNNGQSLEGYILDEYIEHAKEVDVDAICDGYEVQIIGLLEHIESAGIHSGDSHMTIPSFSLSTETIERIKTYTKAIGLEAKIIGLFNIQFIITRDELVLVIEVNPRASRTVPFISKVHHIAYTKRSVEIMLNKKSIADYSWTVNQCRIALKIPIFSDNKFQYSDRSLGPEMRSTGETIIFIEDFNVPFFLSIKNRHR